MSRILIIDDETVARKALHQALTKAGYSVLEASDGTSGLELAKGSKPDLIICDIDMPGMTGFETLTALKADDRTKDVPFVFLTGSSDAITGKLGRMLGAEEFIEKPFSFSKLLAVVGTRLKHSSSSH